MSIPRVSVRKIQDLFIVIQDTDIPFMPLLKPEKCRNGLILIKSAEDRLKEKYFLHTQPYNKDIYDYIQYFTALL